MSEIRECAICAQRGGDGELLREEVWRDAHWRLSMSIESYTPGFGYLEPLRHIPHVEDLDGEEASTFGPTLARVCGALKAATDAERVWVYVFGGGIPHLHVHLAPHREGDALNSAIIRGELDDIPLPSGAHRLISREFSERPATELRAAIERTRELLAS
ncbi:MAG: HIT family protein [Chloroflexota bacterium]